MDELESQLRRYADAAEQRVPPAPSVRPTGNQRGRLLAVAAVVALLGGSVAVFAATRDTDRIDTVPSDDTTTVPPLHLCPTPADEPRPHHLQPAPRHLTGGRADRTNEGSTPTSERFSVFVSLDEDEYFEVQVRELEDSEPAAGPEPGARTVQLRVCDPFRADGNPREVTGQVADRLYDRRLIFTLGDRWSVTVRAAPAAQSRLTQADLFDIVAGLTWPASADAAPTASSTATSTEDCAPNPPMAIEVGSMLVTAAPDGYEPQLPVLFESFGESVDLGGTERHSLSLVHQRHGPIQITSFATESPAAYLDEHIVVGDAEHRTVRMCRQARGGSADERVTLTRNGGTLAVAAQVWEYEGFFVLGPVGSEEAILEVVAGLRLPF